MTTNETPTEPGCWEGELLEQLATFLKYSTIYPNNNRRVVQSLTEVLEMLERVKKVHGSRLILSLQGDGFVLADVPVENDSAVKEWMHEAFVRTALGGVEIDATVGRQPMANFAAQLRDNCGSPEKNFHKLWERNFRGVRPLELRFAGGDAGDGVTAADNGRGALAGSDHVVGELLRNGALMAKLDNLRGMLEANLPEGETAQINLLDPIRQALPIEAVIDPKAACDLVDQILEILGSKVRAMVDQEAFSDQEAMQIGLASIGRRYFKARVQNVGEIPTETLPEGRPEDESTVDDLELMLAEYELLPRGDIRFELDLEGVDCIRETLGVCVHHLVTTPDADSPAVGMIKGLLKEHREHSDLLQPYVDRALADGGLVEENRKLWRLIELLQDYDPVGLLAGREFLTPEVVEFTFPRQLVPFLDSVRSTDQDRLDRIAGIFENLGTERILAAGDYLIEVANLITRKRLHKLLSVDSDALLPLVGLIAQVSDDWIREAVARFIRRRNPPIKESAALRVVRPLNWLSPTYLSGLCVCDPSPEHQAWLQHESSRLLRVFLRDTASRDEFQERRLRAVHMLSALPNGENMEFLREVIKERRFGLFRFKSRGLRKAARRARKQIQRQLVRENR